MLREALRSICCLWSYSPVMSRESSSLHSATYKATKKRHLLAAAGGFLQLMRGQDGPFRLRSSLDSRLHCVAIASGARTRPPPRRAWPGPKTDSSCKAVTLDDITRTMRNEPCIMDELSLAMLLNRERSWERSVRQKQVDHAYYVLWLVLAAIIIAACIVIQ